MPVALRRAVVALAVAVGSVAAVTPIVVLLETVTDIDDTSSTYLIAVVAAAVAAGPAAGVASAVVAVGAYNLLFTEPRFTLVVHATTDWLTLLLLLGVGTVVGELAGAQRARAEAAARREHEARVLASATRALVATDALRSSGSSSWAVRPRSASPSLSPWPSSSSSPSSRRATARSATPTRWAAAPMPSPERICRSSPPSSPPPRSSSTTS